MQLFTKITASSEIDDISGYPLPPNGALLKLSLFINQVVATERSKNIFVYQLSFSVY